MQPIVKSLKLYQGPPAKDADGNWVYAETLSESNPIKLEPNSFLRAKIVVVAEIAHLQNRKFSISIEEGDGKRKIYQAVDKIYQGSEDAAFLNYYIDALFANPGKVILKLYVEAENGLEKIAETTFSVSHSVL